MITDKRNIVLSDPEMRAHCQWQMGWGDFPRLGAATVPLPETPVRLRRARAAQRLRLDLVPSQSGGNRQDKARSLAAGVERFVYPQPKEKLGTQQGIRCGLFLADRELRRRLAHTHSSSPLCCPFHPLRAVVAFLAINVF